MKKVIGAMILGQLALNIIIVLTLVISLSMNKEFIPNMVDMYHQYEIQQIYAEADELELPD